MKIIRIVIVTMALSVSTLMGFSQGDRALTYPVTYVEAVVDAATLQSLAHGFSVDRVDRNADGTFKTRICLSFKEFDDFLAMNVPYTSVPRTRANVRMAQNYEQMITDWNRYPTYSTYLAMMDTFRTHHPNLCEIDTILAATPGNHKILCAHISNHLSDNQGKPSVLYISTIHGDEVVGYYMMLRLIHYLLNNYGIDSYATYLVNNIDLWICPLYNPDGTYFSSNSQINETPISIRYNRHFEDLNRIFPEAGQPIAKSDNEPEVEAMMAFMSAHNFTLAANLHGGAEVFNYPWDRWMTWQRSHADANWWNYVGRSFADTCHLYNANYMTEEDYGVTEGGDWYVITGSMQDYHNWYLGTRHVTIEVGNNKVEASNQLPNLWGYAYRSLLNYIAEADNGIHGTVTDSVTGEPLEALVYIADHDVDHSYVESVLPYGDYHRPIKAGQYTVTYSAEGYLPKTIVTNIADGQRLEQNVQLVKSVGVEDYEQNVAVYPNPVRDMVRVEVADGMEMADIELYDMHGRIVGTFHETSLQQTRIVQLDLRAFPAGTYFLHIRTNTDFEIIRKIVKQ